MNYQRSKSGRLIVPDEGVRGYRPSDVPREVRRKQTQDWRERQPKLAWARVGTPASAPTSTTSLPISYTPGASGNFLAFWVHQRGSTNPVASISDNGAGGGSTWLTAFNGSAIGGNRTMALFYTKACASGITTITVTLATGSASGYGAVAEYSGGGDLDVGPSTTISGTKTSFTTATLSPTGLDLELAMFSTANSTSTWTISAPFAQVTQGLDDSHNDNILTADQINASTATATATIASSLGDGYLVTFKAAAAAGASDDWFGSLPSEQSKQRIMVGY